jgi:hypothetical protein
MAGQRRIGSWEFVLSRAWCFGEALGDDGIDAIISYMRSFCANKSWPLGDLNFPLALNTEKAFPEDEIYSDTVVRLDDRSTFMSISAADVRATRPLGWQSKAPSLLALW